MKRQILVSATVIAFLWPACAQAEIVYEVIDLGTVGGFGSSACSINDAGQIVGWAYKSLWASSHATLFDPTGAGNNLDLGTLGGKDSEARSINEPARSWDGRTRVGAIGMPLCLTPQEPVTISTWAHSEAIEATPTASTRLALSWEQPSA